MSQIPSLAIVLEGGMIQCLIAQDWPDPLPRPRVVVVDYDTDGAGNDELTRFSIGGKPFQALCHSEKTLVYETLSQASSTLSPRTLLAAIGEPVDDAGTESP